jgi:hypothetical protein
VIPSGPILPPNVNLLASQSQFPPPHYAIFFVTRFTSQTESQFLQNAGGSVFSGNVNAKNPGPRLRVFHDLDQMTRHFCGKTATLKFWKSEIRDLDFAAPWGRAKCARADYRVGFENQISIHGG